MKKSLTKKLFLSILTVAFAVVCLGTTTFAWFTTTTTSTVEKFDFDVQGGSGFEVAVTAKGVATNDSTNWYSGSVPAKAITDLINTSTFKFDAVTTTTASLFTFYKNTVSANKLVSTETTTTGFLAFDFHFRLVDKTDSGNHSITVSDVAFSDDTNSKSWTPSLDYVTNQTTGGKVLTGKAVEYDVSSCARLGFGGTTIVYEADTSADTTATDNSNPDSPVTYVTKVGNTKGFSDKAKGALQFYLASNSSVSCDTVPTTYTTVASLDTESTVVTTSSFSTPKTLTVYVWLEGWDGECMNAVLGHKLGVSFKFNLI